MRTPLLLLSLVNSALRHCCSTFDLHVTWLKGCGIYPWPWPRSGKGRCLKNELKLVKCHSFPAHFNWPLVRYGGKELEMQFSKCEETQNPKAPQLEMIFFADHAESMFLAGETRGNVWKCCFRIATAPQSKHHNDSELGITLKDHLKVYIPILLWEATIEVRTCWASTNAYQSSGSE